MKIALAQIHTRVGDFSFNLGQIQAACRQARQQGAGLVLFPELVLCGYPPEDLLSRSSFLQDCQTALQNLSELLKEFTDMLVIVGHPASSSQGLVNQASVFRAGELIAQSDKRALPNYQVFDELRYFVPGAQTAMVDYAQRRWGVAICEDIWDLQRADELCAQGAQGLLVLNASPYARNKLASRIQVARNICLQYKIPLVYCNAVGGQDELVFDGNSFVMDAQGQVQHQLAHCQAQIACVDLAAPVCAVTQPQPQAELYQVLLTGLRDYVQANRFQGVILGLSGGVDSTLVLALACDALGSERVRAVMMPSRYTAEMSLEDARALAKNFGVHYEEISIEPLYQNFMQALAPSFAGRAADLAEENIQARVRGVLLMALSNKFGQMVLATGNKSELTTGYCTIYGDMVGGFAPIKDVVKTEVYRLSKWRNREQVVIPNRILERAPSAELRDNQTDQDNLPSYEVIDQIIAGYVEQGRSRADLVADGIEAAAVDRVVSLLHANEYKRRQGPIGTRVTDKAYGRDWRYPLSKSWTR